MDLRLPSRRLHYAVSFKAEIEIMALHEKLDQIRSQETILLPDQIRDRAEHVLRIAVAATGESPSP